jgi:predicted  nucleic acid-binding Zn-ribbon protein
VREGLQQLLELSRLDDELAAFEAEVAELPARRERIATEREQGESRVLGAQEALKQAEVVQRQAESALREHEALLQKLEGQQFQVKSNDAYTALLHEMEHAKEAISSAETLILECMESIEAATSGLAEADAALKAGRTRFDEEEGALDARGVELEEETRLRHAEREKLGPTVARDLLNQYERVAKVRRPAVVAVTGELCGGCRVGIPAQQFIEILRGERVVECGNCRRILMHQGKAPGDEDS